MRRGVILIYWRKCFFSTYRYDKQLNFKTMPSNHLLCRMLEVEDDIFTLKYNKRLYSTAVACQIPKRYGYSYYKSRGFGTSRELAMWRLTLHWRHNGHDSVSNHQPRDCLLNRLLRRRSKKTSKLRVTGLCARHSPGTGEFPAQMASNADNVSIWWRHHDMILKRSLYFYTERDELHHFVDNTK